MSFGFSSVSSLQDLDAVLAALDRVEIGRELDLRVALEQRIGRHPLIGLDGELRTLDRLVEVAERQQRQRMRRLEVERELQVDQRQVLTRRAGSARRRCRRALRRRRPARELTSGGIFLPAFASRMPSTHQRMTRKLLVERLIDGGRRFAACRCATASGHRHRRPAARSRRACRRARAVAPASFGLLARSYIRPTCRSLKIGYHSGPASLSTLAAAAFTSPAPIGAQPDSSAATRSVIGPRTDWLMFCCAAA